MAPTKKLELPEVIEASQVDEIDVAGVIDKSMPAFSRAANLREIPDVRDGFFPGRRRIMYTADSMGLSATSDFMKAMRVIGECFVAGALVSVPGGLRPIEEIEVGDLVLGSDGIPRPVVAAYANPPGDIVRVTGKNGYHIDVTPGQLFRVVNDDLTITWCAARDLAGRRVLLAPATYASQVAEYSLGSLQYAYALGLVVAEGWRSHRNQLNDRRISISMVDPEPLEALEDWAKGAGVAYTRGQRKPQMAHHQKQYVLSFPNDTGMYETTEQLSFAKRVPPDVLRDRGLWAPFLAGFLDGDGYVRRGRREVVFTTTSELLYRDLAAMLSGLAIKAHVWRRARQQPHHHDLIGLTVGSDAAVRLAQLLMNWVMIPNKREALSDIVSTEGKRSGMSKDDRLPGAIIFATQSAAHHGGGWFMGADGVAFRMRMDPPGSSEVRYGIDGLGLSALQRDFSISQALARGWDQKFDRIGSQIGERLRDLQGLSFVRIASVKEVAQSPTFDIQVASEDHAFVVDGFLVHNCMGKLHPHGDQAIYSAIENLTAPYKVRYPLVDGQGNWGSLNGDSPAAPRYTEMRLTRLGEQIVRDLYDEKANVVPWRDNYDGTQREPALLPTRFPVLLANGIDGIGNGYATLVLPHNLRELVAACVALIDEPGLAIDKLARLMPGPDFPGGGIMIGGADDWKQILESGQGRVIVRAKMHIEEAGRRQKLIVTELPFRVMKGNRGKSTGVIEQIMVKVNGTKEDRDKGKTPPLAGIINNVIDESDRKGMRLVIVLEGGVSVDRAVNMLYQETGLQTSYSANYTVWANGLPEVLGTKGLLLTYLDYQFSVLTRRTQFFLRRDERELLINKARIIANANATEVIKIVQGSASTEDAVNALMAKYKLAQVQAEAITEMQVRTFARLNIKAISDRIAVLEVNVAEYKRLLGTRAAMNEQLKSELREIAAKFGDDRRTAIDRAGSAEVKSADEMIEDEPCWLSLAQSGLIARLRGDAFKSQRRGGAGVAGTAKPEEDPVVQVLSARTRDRVWLLTDAGNLFGLRVADVEEVARGGKGMNVRRFLNLTETEKVAKMVILPAEHTAEPVKGRTVKAAAKPAADAEGQLVVATAGAKVIRSAVSDYANLNSGGLRAIKLVGDDRIVSALVSRSGTHLLSVSSDGYAIRFDIDDVPIQGRGSQGVVSQKLGPGAQVVSLTAVEPKDSGDLGIVLSNGKGKRSKLADYPLKGRAARGVITADLSTAGRGQPVGVVFAARVGDEDEVFFTSSSGKAIVMVGREIKRQGRATAGVTTVALSASVRNPETVTGGNVRVANGG